MTKSPISLRTYNSDLDRPIGERWITMSNALTRISFFWVCFKSFVNETFRTARAKKSATLPIKQGRNFLRLKLPQKPFKAPIGGGTYHFCRFGAVWGLFCVLWLKFSKKINLYFSEFQKLLSLQANKTPVLWEQNKFC